MREFRCLAALDSRRERQRLNWTQVVRRHSDPQLAQTVISRPAPPPSCVWLAIQELPQRLAREWQGSSGTGTFLLCAAPRPVGDSQKWMLGRNSIRGTMVH